MDVRSTINALRQNTKTYTLASVQQMSISDNDPFRVLIATIISLRTKDQVTIAAADRLFKLADSPSKTLKLDGELIAQLIYPAGFYRRKAKQIIAVAKILVEEYDSVVPSSKELLLRLPGVGLKTANLTLGLAFKIPAICVDTHVHRLANRFAWIKTKTPDASEAALQKVVARVFWIELNDLLIKHGQNICTPVSPFCSTCFLSSSCPKVGVLKYR